VGLQNQGAALRSLSLTFSQPETLIIVR
jgi:hypothetical protein